ncbi:MAG: protein kinase [Chloroflexota bacterium]
MSHYITKAPLPDDEPALYVQRNSDTQFDDYLYRCDYIAVIGPKHSGKTSLLARKYHQLQSRQRFLPICINMSPLASLDIEAWYQRLHSLINERVGGDLEDEPLASNPLALRDVLLEMLKNRIDGRVLVIILDDVEAIPKVILTPFMAMVREIFSNREVIEAFKRCVFVLAGCFLPDELIDDPLISPFRVAERIHMLDATPKGVTQLTSLINTSDGSVPDWLAEHVYSWTEGDVYLTQRLCTLLERHEQLTAELVDQLALKLIEDEIFYRVKRYLDNNPMMLTLLDRIRIGASPIRFTRLQRHIAHAWLAGILREDANGNCAIRNRIYKAFLDLEVFFDGNPAESSPNSDTTDYPVGTKVVLQRRYVLENSLEPGGMGEVFRATDLVTRETVAIKRLLPALVSHPIFAERFQREGESLRQLDHPNIVRFIDLLVIDDSKYIIMEYVHGGSLSQLMHREGRSLSVQTALKIMTGLADALAHAHTKDIIHRDIKPGNVLLTADLIPRLADFGLARLLSGDRLTEVGVVVGTYAYMSPEVRRGEDASVQSDMWSLGVMLFEMLTGYLPFNRDIYPNAMHDGQSTQIPDIRTLREDIPEGVSILTTRLLAHNPAQRYASALELGVELRMLSAALSAV